MKWMMTFFLFCASRVTAPEHSRDQIAQAQGHVFSDVSRDQVIMAIKETFKFVSPSNVKFQRSGNGIKTIRRFSVMLAGVVETWDFQIAELDSSTVHVMASAHVQVDNFSRTPRNTFPYELIFTRLGYMLDQGNSWETCEEYKVRTGLNEQTSEYDFLCESADDVHPQDVWTRTGKPF